MRTKTNVFQASQGERLMDPGDEPELLSATRRGDQ